MSDNKKIGTATIQRSYLQLASEEKLKVIKNIKKYSHFKIYEERYMDAFLILYGLETGELHPYMQKEE